MAARPKPPWRGAQSADAADAAIFEAATTVIIELDETIDNAAIIIHELDETIEIAATVTNELDETIVTAANVTLLAKQMLTAKNEIMLTATFLLAKQMRQGQARDNSTIKSEQHRPRVVCRQRFGVA